MSLRSASSSVTATDLRATATRRVTIAHTGAATETGTATRATGAVEATDAGAAETVEMTGGGTGGGTGLAITPTPGGGAIRAQRLEALVRQSKAAALREAGPAAMDSVSPKAHRAKDQLLRQLLSRRRRLRRREVLRLRCASSVQPRLNVPRPRRRGNARPNRETGP